MNPTLRRVFMFGAMVTTGVGALWLLQEDPTPARSGTARTTDGGDGDTVGLVHRETDTRVEVTMGELDFDVTRDVEVAPGVFESRPVYRIQVRDGHPGPDGAFLVTSPVITFLDVDTRAVRGVLEAAKGRFETDQGASGKLRFDFGDIRAERFTLSDDVRGEFPLRGGGTAHLQAGNLSVDGPIITAPGTVSWQRDDLALTGVDMRWDETTGRLTYGSSAELTLVEADGTEAVLRAPGGLLWNVPVDAAEGRGWGELYGPVTGESSDGSRLAAETLLVGADARSLTLRGAARLEAPQGTRTWRAKAPHITVSRHEDGSLALGQADGGVRLEDVADPESWLEAESLTSVAGVFTAPGPVSWSHAGLTTTGNDLRWDEATGGLELASDVLLIGGHRAEDWLVGARLRSPRGLDWTVTAPGEEGGFGRLRGPVDGTLADGSELRCDVLEWNELARRATLSGDASVRRLGLLGTDELAADRLELTLDDAGGLAGALCTDDVRVVRTPVAGPGSLLSADRLELLGDLALVPGPVVLAHGRFGARGTGLRYDDRGGRLDLEQDATLTLTDDQGQELSLESPNGFQWWLPDERSLGPAAGRGELAGPVSGRTPDGGSLRADRGRVHGGQGGLELFGGAEIRWEQLGHVASEHLDLRSGTDGLRARSNEYVEWSRGPLEGAGWRMALDEAAGTLTFESEVAFIVHGEGGAARLAVSCAGPMTWTSPPGSDDPVSEGRGEFRDEVVGREVAGGSFATDRLVFDGPAGLLELHGPSQLEHEGLGTTLEATLGIGLERDPAGTLRRLEATGTVRGHLGQEGSEVHLQAEELLVDRSAQLLTLRGSPPIITRGDGERALSLTTVGDGVITARTDDLDALTHVDVEGRVSITTGELSALSDHLAWDVVADHVVLEGNCRFLSIGGWLDAPRVEIWPEAVRWHVPRSVIVVDER